MSNSRTTKTRKKPRYASVGYMLTGIALLFILAACSPGCTLQGAERSDILVIMSWNVENLFDGTDNGTEYQDFDPGEGNWDTARYHVRLAAVSRLILELADPQPDIICLQEVEHRGVVNDLAAHYLGKEGYTYTAVTEASNSAVQQAVISKYPITSAKVHAGSGLSSYSSRPVLEVSVQTGNEVVILLNNHWKSRREGPEQTELSRLESARAAASVIEEHIEQNSRALILLAGDLNENADEYERVNRAYKTALMPVSETGGGLTITGIPEEAIGSVLYNGWLDKRTETGLPGSYSYRGAWSTLDHIMISSAGFDGTGWDFAAFDVYAHSEILSESNQPAGWDMRSGLGYSDHLPVVMQLERVRSPAPLE
ncbi:MAG: endonuclease/exonuclease/phosphatase family protein [Spirochaetia bacterium]|nr:endonuclease/exonuclease/phosphatase family protein [Spirochaetia bacterium]